MNSIWINIYNLRIYLKQKKIKKMPLNINKAIGWALRDYSKTNGKWVEDFINRYRDKMTLLSIKEGSKYI